MFLIFFNVCVVNGPVGLVYFSSSSRCMLMVDWLVDVIDSWLDGWLI